MGYKAMLDEVCAAPHSHVCARECAAAESLATHATDYICRNYCQTSLCAGASWTLASSAINGCQACVSRMGYPASMQAEVASVSSGWADKCTSYASQVSDAVAAQSASSASSASSRSAAVLSSNSAARASESARLASPARTQSPGMLAAAALVGALVL